jgi:Na+/H+-dicarboxylate symporter
MLTIIVTCTIAAVGAAGVPGAGMITLMIVLQSVHVPVEAIALIMAPDRLLDMFRSLVNVAGDATAAVALGEKETE